MQAHLQKETKKVGKKGLNGKSPTHSAKSRILVDNIVTVRALGSRDVRGIHLVVLAVYFIVV
jgi:hypothetical protein